LYIFQKGSKVIICSYNSSRRVGQPLIAMFVGIAMAHFAHAGGPGIANDRFTNIGSIANTRHNMTQSTAPLIAVNMDAYRNEYGEVCVYCHTPHGANQTIAAPLWNRTIKPTAYKTYDELGTTSLTQAVSQPGPASLTCLSCHDGQTAIDSIINMPGSGMGQISQQTSQNTAFLDTWAGEPNHVEATQHMGLNSTNGELGNGTGSATPHICAPATPGCIDMGGGIWVGIDPGKGCLSCHSDTGSAPGAGSYVNFSMFLIGTDLRNDHPVGVTFPALNGPGTDWNTPSETQGSSNYFETIANGRMDKEEIRTYEGKVECASCHDPHGVPSAGPGSIFNKTFLRKQNTDGSAVCLTCHNK
jgi:hypothetical protein